jgi:hypothetical protein
MEDARRGRDRSEASCGAISVTIAFDSNKPFTSMVLQVHLQHPELPCSSLLPFPSRGCLELALRYLTLVGSYVQACLL